MLITLLFLMSLLHNTPNVILSGINITAVARLIDVRGTAKLWKVDKLISWRASPHYSACSSFPSRSVCRGRRDLAAQDPVHVRRERTNWENNLEIIVCRERRLLWRSAWLDGLNYRSFRGSSFSCPSGFPVRAPAIAKKLKKKQHSLRPKCQSAQSAVEEPMRAT